MADFKILEKNGYEELGDVQASIEAGALDVKALWDAVGQGDTAQAAIILFAAGFGQDGEEVEDVKDVMIVSVPDDILGERYRIWMKMSASDGR